MHNYNLRDGSKDCIGCCCIIPYVTLTVVITSFTNDCSKFVQTYIRIMTVWDIGYSRFRFYKIIVNVLISLSYYAIVGYNYTFFSMYNYMYVESTIETKRRET